VEGEEEVVVAVVMSIHSIKSVWCVCGCATKEIKNLFCGSATVLPSPTEVWYGGMAVLSTTTHTTFVLGKVGPTYTLPLVKTPL
jgi:hypothetical protein